MSRAPARKGKADSNHKAIADAIRVLGYPVMDLSAAGNGVEDLLVALDKRNGAAVDRFWVLVEIKVARNKRGEATPSQFTQAQKIWREVTARWPRLTVTSAQNAVDSIYGLAR